jgi:hypothetical protein
MVEELSSYHGLPVNLTFSAAQGREMVLIPTARLLSGYWSEFGQYSAYEVFIEGKVPEILIKTKSGNRVVGACIRKGRGALLLIPALKLDEEECVEPTETGEPGDEEEDEDQVGNTASRWTKEGEIFGHKLELALVALADSISADVAATPRPDWTHGDSFRQPEESSIENSIQKISKKTLELEEERRRLESQLDASGSLRSLLYEQGKPLERAVLEALELLGFAAKRFSSDGSEFDAVFESPEGRFIGEVEGKDNRAVNIDKFSQLERNLNEDFAREEVSAHAKGVLFGNAFRLKPPTERDPAFTEKCKAAALRTGVALVSTPDLFAACRYLKSSHDADYAATCRRAIFEMRGDIVKFPEPPTGDTLAKEMELRQVENAS